MFAVLRRNYGRCLDFFYKSTRVTSGGKCSILKKPGLDTSTTDGPVLNIFKIWTCAKKFSKTWHNPKVRNGFRCSYYYVKKIMIYRIS